MYHGIASIHPKMNAGISKRMNSKLGKGLGQMMKGADLQQSSNPLARSYGRMLENNGEKTIQGLGKKWDFENDRYNIKQGLGGAFNSITNIGNPRSSRYRSRPNIANYGSENDSI